MPTALPCSGGWVTPAFQLHRSKLDLIQPRPIEELASVRRPLVGPSTGPGPVTPVPLGPEAAAPVPAAPGSTFVDSSNGAAAAVASASGAGTEKLGCGTVEISTSIHTATASAATPWITHVIFDCDGVLVDTERASCEALRLAILKATGFDIPHEFPVDFREVFGTDVRTSVQHYKTKFDRCVGPIFNFSMLQLYNVHAPYQADASECIDLSRSVGHQYLANRLHRRSWLCRCMTADRVRDGKIPAAYCSAQARLERR